MTHIPSADVKQLLSATRMPTQDELPYSDDEVMESECHAQQQPLLKEPLVHHWRSRKDFYVGTDMFVYFSPTQQLTHDFKGPDVFVVTGVRQHPRKSYLVWDEGKVPDVVIELTSDSTSKIDKGAKMKVYQDRLKVPEYFWCDPYTDDFAGFRLHRGVYRSIAPDANGMLHSKTLGLALTRWQGKYLDIEANWLRWATAEGVLLPTSDERAAQKDRSLKKERELRRDASKRAEDQKLRADDEKLRADRLLALLKQHGINPDQ